MRTMSDLAPDKCLSSNNAWQNTKERRAGGRGAGVVTAVVKYSARGGGSLQARGLKGRSWSPKGREQRWGFRPPTRGFRAFKALCLAFMAFK